MTIDHTHKQSDHYNVHIVTECDTVTILLAACGLIKTETSTILSTLYYVMCMLGRTAL